MNNNKKLRQVFLFIVLGLFAISLPISIYILKTGNFDLRIGAFVSEEPVRVTITDRSASSFKVFWITEKSVFGAVKINETGDVISENFESNSHYLEISNLEANKDYTITIFSGTNEFPQTLPIKTLSSSEQLQNNYYIFGQIFDKTGIKVQQKGIITLQAFDGNASSEVLGSTINETGGFQINLKDLLLLNSGKSFNFNKTVDVTLTIYTSLAEDPVVKKYSFNFSTQKQIPNIYLGDINLDIIPGVEGN